MIRQRRNMNKGEYVSRVVPEDLVKRDEEHEKFMEMIHQRAMKDPNLHS